MIVAELRETRLVLIRHGESIANQTGVLGGHDSCSGLTDCGRAQAAALRDRAASTGLFADAAAILCSVLPRAIQTAEIVAPAAGGGNLTPQAMCDLCEVHWGALDGRRETELVEPESMFETVAPQGESWLTFTLRARRVLQRLAREQVGRTVVAVTHSGIIKASLRFFDGTPEQQLSDLDLAYTGVTVWEGQPAAGRPWRLARFDDHAHLLPSGKAGG